jgi:hypothetical protein
VIEWSHLELRLLISLLKDFDQSVRTISDNAIDPHLEKVFHMFFRVEGPDKNLNPLLPRFRGIGLCQNRAAKA